MTSKLVNGKWEDEMEQRFRERLEALLGDAAREGVVIEVREWEDDLDGIDLAGAEINYTRKGEA